MNSNDNEWVDDRGAGADTPRPGRTGRDAGEAGDAGSVGDCLSRVELFAAALESAAAAGDWDRLASLDTGLLSALKHLQRLLSDGGLPQRDDDLMALNARLTGVRQCHDRVALKLAGARDCIASELGQAVQGHRGAARYLDAAKG